MIAPTVTSLAGRSASSRRAASRISFSASSGRRRLRFGSVTGLETLASEMLTATMAIRLAWVLLVVSGLVAASAALAAKGQQARTFQGTCQFSGVLSQQPPITNLPQPGAATARALGICSGTLTGKNGRVRELDASPARYVARAAGEISCGGGTAA